MVQSNSYNKRKLHHWKSKCGLHSGSAFNPAPLFAVFFKPQLTPFWDFTKVAAFRHCFGEISTPCRQCSLMLRTSSRLLPVNSKEHDLLCSPLNCNKPHIISARNSGKEFGIYSEFRSGSTEVKHVFTTDLLKTFHPACLVSIRL